MDWMRVAEVYPADTQKLLRLLVPDLMVNRSWIGLARQKQAAPVLEVRWALGPSQGSEITTNLQFVVEGVATPMLAPAALHAYVCVEWPDKFKSTGELYG